MSPAIWWRRCRPARRSTRSTRCCGASVSGCRSIRRVRVARRSAASSPPTTAVPRRHRYGTPRDLIIGIEIALADGRIAKAGGRVVKNVAGYDLSKLLCGSLGSLAVVTARRSSWRRCLPHRRRWSPRFRTPGAPGRLPLAFAGSTLTPSTVELQSPPHRSARSLRNIAARHRAAGRGGRACVPRTVRHRGADGQEEADAWRAHERRWRASRHGVKLATLPTDVAGDALARSSR